MTLRPLLIIVSLAANLALVGAFAFQPAFAPPAFRGFLVRHFQSGEPPAAAPAIVPAAQPKTGSQLWSALKTDDLATLVARLRAAGFPVSLIRAIIGSVVSARYDTRMRALLEPDPNTPYWKQSGFLTSDSKNYAEYTRLQRERSKLMRELFSDPAFASDDVSAAQRRQFGNLPRQKIDLLQRIEDDYGDMDSAVRTGMNGVTLPEDREKLALLASEKRADLAAVLTPDELADYELRSSPLVNLLGRYLGGFDSSEAEFRAVFQALQKYSSTVAPTGDLRSVDPETRLAALQQLNTDLKASLGDARYADYQRETNRDFQQLSRVAQQENIPAATALQAYNLRDTVAEESNRIFDDASLTPDQKRLALQTLAQNTRARTLALLGPTAGQTYLKIQDSWLSNVERGSAITFSNTSTTSSIVATVNGTTTMLTFTGGPSYRQVTPTVAPRSGP